MSQMEIDLSRKLEWCAVVHTNTAHPHVHVALRGVSERQALRLPRTYIKSGIRDAAENLCTAQLGYRTEMDAISAERREISEQRFTSLDRALVRSAKAVPDIASAPGERFQVEIQYPPATASESVRARAHHLRARLVQLQTMGLAISHGNATWQVRRDFGAVLKAMQRAQDRQRLLHVHGALLSDSRLPMVVTPLRRLGGLAGRVLVHGEEETGRMYVLMEGIDAQVHYISHTAEITRAWSQGALRPNSFVRLRRMFDDNGRPFVEITDLGDADRLLRNESLMRDLARESMPAELQHWNGWLGRYGAALLESARYRERKSQLHER